MTQQLFLLRQLSLRAVQQRFRGSVLGWGWIIGQPLLMMAVYTTVFGVIFGGSYGGQADDSTLAYALGIFLSLTVYGVFSDVVNASPTAILGNAIYVKKVRFPLEVLPLSSLAVPWVNLAVQLVLVLVFGVSTGFLDIGGLIPSGVMLAILLIGSAGLAFWISALGVFFRDIQQLASVFSLVGLYASAVFYSSVDAQSAQPELWAWLRINPLLHLVENVRGALLFGLSVDWVGVTWSGVCAVLTLVSGVVFFRWIKSSFADVL